MLLRPGIGVLKVSYYSRKCQPRKRENSDISVLKWEFELPRLVNIINHTEKVARRYGVMTFDWSVSMNSRDLSLSLCVCRVVFSTSSRPTMRMGVARKI